LSFWRVPIENALQFVRAARLRGGTDLQAAVTAALGQAAQGVGERYIVLLTDGGATRGTIANARLVDWFEQQMRAIPAAERPRPYVFAVGDDANMPLLRIMGRQDGIVEWVRSTEPLDFKLSSFLSKIGRRPVEGLNLSAAPAGAFDLIYPLESSPFAGSMANWVGLYKQSNVEATFRVTGLREDGALAFESRVTLPEESLEHPHVPRTWARARVDALLEKIEREGEDRATIDEIIRLAKKFKFVTPYTSFLAAPRSLLRPRVIRPGDPVLRVRTDASIVSVTALFPFGLVKKLKFLGGEDIWQTRFLAPTDMEDGEHHVRLVLRDREGRVYRESKSFVIASKPPVVRIHLDKKQFRRGEAIDLKVSASQSTRTLVARLYGTAPVELRWDEKAKYNTGTLVVPEHLPAGEYRLLVTAEDFAHNIGTQEVSLAVAP
jgi:Ca-activated chloride channel family protein